MNWIAENAELSLAIITALSGLFIYISVRIQKIFSNWLKLNYIPRKELQEKLDALEDSVNEMSKEFSRDMVKTTEAGMLLANQVNTQIQQLMTTIISRGHHDDQ